MTPEQLANAWLAIKATERAAQQERIDIEAALIAALGGAKDEGSSTHEVGPLKVTLTGKLTYKADIAELLALVEKLPESLRPIKTTTQLDEAGARYLRNNEGDLWRLIANAIEVKPAKTALTIKEP